MEWTTEVGCAYTASFTIGASASDVLVTIQLKDYAGNALTVKNAFDFYISSDADGDTTSTITSLAIASGIIHEIEDAKAYQLISEDTGIASVTLTLASATTRYLNVVLPNGKIVTSPVITFTT